MKSDRREAIKNILIFAGGVLFLPSCLQEEGKDFLSFKNINLNEEEKNLLTTLASTIIPLTNTPGAVEVKAHLFALKIVNDCYEKEDQQKFIKGLWHFDKLVNKRYGNSFTDIASAQNEEFLNELEKDDQISEVHFFYSRFKKLCIRGYLNSKYYMTKVQPYQLVPVHYYGCMPVKIKNKKNNF